MLLGLQPDVRTDSLRSQQFRLVVASQKVETLRISPSEWLSW
jgi:hypothetical protein